MVGVERDDVGALRPCVAGRRRGCASACAPPASAASNSARPVEMPGPPASTLRCAMLQTLAVFELAQFVGDVDQDIGIRADAEAAAGVAGIHVRRKDAVAEAGFGDRAKPGDGAARGQR